MQLELPSRIVVVVSNLESEFDHRFWSDLDFNDEIVSTFPSVFNQFSIKRSKMIMSMSIILSKKVEFNQKCQSWLKIQLFLTTFDQIQSIFDINQTIYNWICREDAIRLQKFGLKKLIQRRFESDFKRNLAKGRSNRISLARVAEIVIVSINH